MATLEERFAALESRVVELERQRAVQEERDIALLARIDNFIDDLRRIERVQLRSFDAIMAHQKEQDARLASLETSVTALEASFGILGSSVVNLETAVATLVDAAKDHKKAIDTLAQGQQQILAILMGEQRLHD